MIRELRPFNSGCLILAVTMGQTESTVTAPAGEPGLITATATPSPPTCAPDVRRPARLPWYDLKIAPDYLMARLGRVADVLTKKTIDL